LGVQKATRSHPNRGARLQKWWQGLGVFTERRDPFVYFSDEETVESGGALTTVRWGKKVHSVSFAFGSDCVGGSFKKRESQM
jgi:hypothetical protein